MSISKVKVYQHKAEFMMRQAKKVKNFKHFMERLGNMPSICLDFHQDMSKSIFAWYV